MSIRKRFGELRNDLGGEEAFDWLYSGRSATVTIKLTRWNEPALLTLENVVGVGGAAAGGIDLNGDIGTLMVTEGQAVPLWIVYSYNANPAFVTMRKGWHFFAAWLEGPDDHEGGTDPATEALVFRCARVYNPQSGSFSLYDHDVSGAAAPN